MKLIIITGSIHFNEEIEKIMDKSDVNIYSRSNISGHRKKESTDLSDNWFVASKHYRESVMFFAFLEANKVEIVMATVNEFNETIDSESQLRLFVMAVEDHN